MIALTLVTKMMACSGILFGYYWLFLRNKRFHHYNRFYLLGASGLSIILPFMKIPIFLEPNTVTGQIVYGSLDIISTAYWENGIDEKSSTNLFSYWFTFQNGLYVLYGVGVFTLLYFLLRSLYYIHWLSKKYSFEVINTLKFYNTTEPGTPFSFFRSIFWNDQLNLDSKEGQQIFRHELFHVKEKHSLDILFLEVVSIFFWINPFFHLIRKEIKAIHEFLADQHALSDNNQHDYAELLILQSINAKKTSVSNYFFQNHIKRRIAMITQFKKQKYSYWTRLMVLPVSILLFCAIALYAQNPTISSASSIDSYDYGNQSLVGPMTVLIDAGHGGSDEGAKNAEGLTEKDLALAIAKQIKHQSSAYNIKVLMTRDQDVYPSLKERTGMASEVKADLLISVHIGSADNTNTGPSGFDIYVTNRNQETMEQSKQLGRSIASEIQGLYQTGPIRQRKEKGIWILDAVTCPAVLIECGNISNTKDITFISKPENQVKIAKSILEGIGKYQSAEVNENFSDTVPKKTLIQDKQKQHELELTQHKIAEARILEIQKEQKMVIQKQQEMELVQQIYNQKKQELEVARNQLADDRRYAFENEQRRHKQKQQEMELVQQLYYKKKQELEVARNQLADETRAAFENDQRLQTQKQKELQIAHRKLAETRNAEFQNEQKLQIQKQNELEIEYSKMVQARNAELQKEHNLILQKQQEMELAYTKLALLEKLRDTVPLHTQDKIFTKVEIEPEYPGGYEAWKNYLNKSLRYPSEAKRKNIAGTVIVEFIVDTSGKINNINAVKGPKELREESERLIRESGVWIPARQNGHLVKAYRKETIVFDR